jgi:hypothetical protein
MFIDMFDEKEEIVESVKPKVKSKSVPDIIRSYVKIKLTVPTNFGTEYILAKKYSSDTMKELLNDLKGHKVKVKGNSLFIEN